MHYSLTQIPFLQELEPSQNILLAGAGGGFDLYAGIPLFLALRKMGKQVHLANLAFTHLPATDARKLTPYCRAVYADTTGPTYFPEKVLAKWLKGHHIEQPIYTFAKTGVANLKIAYQKIIQDWEIDTVILVDGGTDSLMFGEEPGLGTPQEDMASIGAVYGLANVQKFLVCLGFGVDTFHGVGHHFFLENVAELQRADAFLGTIALHRGMPEVIAYAQLVQYANREIPMQPSIVNNSILSAILGHFGNHHSTARTAGSELYINPLMALYWNFELNAVGKRIKYLDKLMDTRTMEEVSRVIGGYRSRVTKKQRKKIPL